MRFPTLTTAEAMELIEFMFPERTAGMDWIREQPYAGQVAQAFAILERHRSRSEAVAACIRYYEANADRMRCDLNRTRGLPTVSGVLESA